jgi:CSLREA domain-containing protein
VISSRGTVRRRRVFLILVALAAGALPQFFAAPPARAAGIAVEILTDELDADSDCSLREAIKSANTNAAVGGCTTGEAGLDTITLMTGTHIVNLGPTGDDVASNGDLDITESLNINGSGASSSIVSFNTNGNTLFDRVFEITSATAVVNFTDMTVQNGDAGLSGGGIYNSGNLTLAQSQVKNNRSGVQGGGIYNSGTGVLTVIESTVSGNNAWNNGNGGGIYNAATANPAVTITDSIFFGNNGNNGGTIANDAGTMTITGSTFSGNTAFRAVILNGGTLAATLNLTNSTISGNTSTSDHGGIWNYKTVNLTNTTITGNRGNTSGALFNDNQVGTPVANLKNSILANSLDAAGAVAVPDCGGEGIAATGPNLVENVSFGGSCSISGTPPITNQDPALGPLTYNGGFTDTHKLQSFSPAVDAGTDTGCPSEDQRDLPRPMDGPDDGVQQKCDLGATELEPDLSVLNTSAIEGDAGQVNLTFTLSLTGTVPEEVKADLMTSDITATEADNDYLPVTSPGFTIQPNTLGTTYEVNIIGDTTDEDNETVAFTAQNLENAAMGQALGTGTIRDDDPLVPHERTVAFRLRRHLKAKGRVTVDDSYNKCRNSVDLDIQRKKPSGWDTIKSITTQNDGEFVTNVPDNPGRYRAKATREEKVAGGDTQVCAPKTSPVRRHRHG